MKVDISVSRKMTINTENYSSVTPSVTITAKDIDAEKLAVAYGLLYELADNMLAIETGAMFSTQDAIKEVGWKTYIEQINNFRTDISADILEKQDELVQLNAE